MGTRDAADRGSKGGHRPHGRAPRVDGRAAPADEPPGERSRAELEEAFWRLWLSCHHDLFRLSLSLMGDNRADAEDAVSRAALRGLAKYPLHVRTMTNPRGWLARLLFNVCMDWHRQRAGLHRAVERLHPDQAAELGFAQAGAPSPERAAAVRERARRTRGSIAALPAHLREPFELRFLGERSYDEIGQRLGLSCANVRKRIQLARAILRADAPD